jgi:hypothetical protein
MMPYNVSLICLRETKLVVIFDFDVIQMLGTRLDYAYLPTMQTRGGVLVDWRSGSFLPLIRVISQYRFRNGSGDAWWFTGVYCSTRDADKTVFLAKLHSLRQAWTGTWLLTEDFNMIYRVEDKNNDRLDRRHMGQFSHLLSVATLKEI